MRLFPQTTLDIGINETRSRFMERLLREQRTYPSVQQASREAQFQALWRDIDMATTVSQLQPILHQMLQELIS